MIGIDGSIRAARVFHVLWHGERIAHDVAVRQAAICDNAKAGRFFTLQASQESIHATVFHAATAMLAPRARMMLTNAVTALDTYRRHLAHDLERGHLVSTIIGLQIVLEGLGALTLAHINLALSRYGARFAPYKRLLEQQEDTHHAFGCRWLAHKDAASITRMAADARRYFELAVRRDR